MRHMAFCALIVLLLAGCGDDAAAPADSGPADTGMVTPPDTGPRPDAGPPPMSVEFMPEGCGYAVRTPEVDGAMMDGDGVGAMPAPDHVHTSWSGPSHTTFAVNWRTDAATTRTQLLYGTDMAMVGAADGEATGVTLVRGHTFTYAPLTDRENPTRIHEVHVCGLDPSTQYFYKVGGPGHWSETFDVSTAPMPGATAPFSFAVLGDSRGGPEVFAEIEARVAERGVDFQLYTGDAVLLGVLQDDWDAFFEATSGDTSVQDVLARVPFMPANGNHESLALNYVAQFSLPQEITTGENGEGEEWYSFDYAGAHVAVLDASASEALIEAQAEWLDADLGAVDRGTTPWVIVMFHQAVYSCSNHGSQLAERAAWQPIFDEHEVDLVFQGHDHNYERSKPIRGFQAGMPMDGEVVTSGGTVYVVAGGAGAPLYESGTCYHTEISESTNNYVVVSIDGMDATIEAFRLDGTMLDTFTVSR